MSVNRLPCSASPSPRRSTPFERQTTVVHGPVVARITLGCSRQPMDRARRSQMRSWSRVQASSPGEAAVRPSAGGQGRWRDRGKRPRHRHAHSGEGPDVPAVRRPLNGRYVQTLVAPTEVALPRRCRAPDRRRLVTTLRPPSQRPNSSRLDPACWFALEWSSRRRQVPPRCCSRRRCISSPGAENL